MTRERVYYWYVEPLDSHTNTVISGHLPTDEICQGILCGDGKQRDLWLCNRGLISRLKRSKRDLNLSFRVFVKEGDNGPIRLSAID